MTVLTEQYVTASEASRILGVSRQRIATMVRDDEIEHIRPWPRQVLIPLRAVQAWAEGERRIPIHKTAVRNWIIGYDAAESIDAMEPERVGQLCMEYIKSHRPEWDDQSKTNWCIGMLRLLMRGSAPR